MLLGGEKVGRGLGEGDRTFGSREMGHDFFLQDCRIFPSSGDVYRYICRGLWGLKRDEDDIGLCDLRNIQDRVSMDGRSQVEI